MVRARASAFRSRSVSGLARDGRALAIATKVLTRNLLRRVNPPPKPLIVYSNN